MVVILLGLVVCCSGMLVLMWVYVLLSELLCVVISGFIFVLVIGVWI